MYTIGTDLRHICGIYVVSYYSSSYKALCSVVVCKKTILKENAEATIVKVVVARSSRSHRDMERAIELMV